MTNYNHEGNGRFIGATPLYNYTSRAYHADDYHLGDRIKAALYDGAPLKKEDIDDIEKFIGFVGYLEEVAAELRLMLDTLEGDNGKS